MSFFSTLWKKIKYWGHGSKKKLGFCSGPCRWVSTQLGDVFCHSFSSGAAPPSARHSRQWGRLPGEEPPCTNKHEQGLWPLTFLPHEQKEVWGLVCLFVFLSKACSDLLRASALQIPNMMTYFPSKQVNKLSNDSLGLACHYSGSCTVITKDSSCSATLQNSGRGDQTNIVKC